MACGLASCETLAGLAFCVGVAALGVASVFSGWVYFDQKLDDQEQANQLIVSTNQNLDAQLKSLDGLQERRNAIIERMKLIQGLQGQRPITVRLVDELDPVAVLALSRYDMRLAKSLAHVVNILDPDVIVLGGGMSNVDRLYATVPNLVKQWVFGGECETPIRKAVHGDSSGVRGAAWLWPE